MKTKTVLTHNTSLKPKEFARLVELIRVGYWSGVLNGMSEETKIFAVKYLQQFNLTIDPPKSPLAVPIKRPGIKIVDEEGQGHPPIAND